MLSHVQCLPLSIDSSADSSVFICDGMMCSDDVARKHTNKRFIIVWEYYENWKANFAVNKIKFHLDTMKKRMCLCLIANQSRLNGSSASSVYICFEPQQYVKKTFWQHRCALAGANNINVSLVPPFISVGSDQSIIIHNWCFF